MRPALRLPLRFDPDTLRAELARIPAEAWTQHYQARDYEGDWSGAALRAVRGSVVPLVADPLDGRADFEDTALLAGCPKLREALETFRCPLRAVRLLRLGPGARILEHRDARMGFEEGEARLHVPIVTDPSVAFFVAGERVSMAPGECWYVDVRKPHRVHNASAAPRVHLVVDCRVNDWLRDCLARGEPPPELGAADALETLVERVVSDETLIARLEPLPDRAAFLAEVLAVAGELGLEVTRGELEARMRENQRAWIERRLR